MKTFKSYASIAALLSCAAFTGSVFAAADTDAASGQEGMKPGKSAYSMAMAKCKGMTGDERTSCRKDARAMRKAHRGEMNSNASVNTNSSYNNSTGNISANVGVSSGTTMAPGTGSPAQDPVSANAPRVKGAGN